MPEFEDSYINRPLQVITACRVRDLPVLEIALQKLPEMVPYKGMCVITPNSDLQVIRRKLGKNVHVIAEDEFIPGVTSRKMQALKTPGFPKMAGWYFQQFLKLHYAFIDVEDDYYLIWDADTIPLRPMKYFEKYGKMLLTKASEYHSPYYETYLNILGEKICYEFSFIAQHMIIQKSVVREMLNKIEQIIKGDDGWVWKIMRSLPKESGTNLFSEYETYGHYIKGQYPDRVKFIKREWLREPPGSIGKELPSRTQLDELAEKYDYAAFERVSKGWKRLVKIVISEISKRR